MITSPVQPAGGPVEPVVDGERSGASADLLPAKHAPVRARPSWPWMVALGAVIAIGVYGRFAGITQGLWTDEVTSILRYTERGPSAIFGEASINNHVLYTFVAWAMQALLWPSEVVYRLPSVVPDLAAIALLGWHLRRTFERAALLAFATIALIAPQHIAFVREARGYGLATLGVAGLLVFGERYIDDRRLRDLAGFGLFGFVGVSSVPVLAAPFSLATAVLVIANVRRPKVWLQVSAMFLVVGAAAGAMLRGVISELTTSYGDFHDHRRILPLDAQDLGAQLGRVVAGLLSPIDAALVRVPLSDVDGLARLGAAVAATALAAVGAWSLVRRGRGGLVALCLVPTLGTVVAAISQALALHDRYLDFTFLPYVVLIAAGLGECWAHRRGRLGLLAWPVLAACVGAPAIAAFAQLDMRGGLVAGAVVFVSVLLAALVLPRQIVAGATLVAVGGIAIVSSVGASHMMSVLDREGSRRIATIMARNEVDTLLVRYASGSLSWYRDDQLLVRREAGGAPRNDVEVEAIISWEMAEEIMCGATTGVAWVENIRVDEPYVPACLVERGARRFVVPLRGGFVVTAWVLPGG